MNRVLIVEDEKLIRQGIVAMLKRVPIQIGEIIETRNGLEALEVLHRTKIDLMITDIRMPKMDGITLVKKVQEIAEKPYILVLSGYDDFNYAIEVMRQGVKDYLLKPIEREKFSKVIQKIQIDLESKDEQKEELKKIGSQQLKYLLLNKDMKREERESIEKQFSQMFYGKQYYMCCIKYKPMSMVESNFIIVLEDLDGQTFFLIESGQLESCMNSEVLDSGMGISHIHSNIAELKQAFKEAVEAREEAFIKCIPFSYYEELKFSYEMVPEDFSEQFVQLFGTQKVEDGLKKFSTLYFKAKMNKIEAHSLLSVTRNIINQLLTTYERIIEFDIEEIQALQEPLVYENAEVYYRLLENWIRKMQQLIMEEFDDYKNKEKITMAVQYIRKNYRNDLNMAVVSNCLSMNYSLFSLNFKQYTGMNFVSYLKKIRIDEAKRLLEETDKKIIDISSMVGYENEKHFMKTFKSICGVSPSEYRRNSWYHKKENEFSLYEMEVEGEK